MKKIIKLLPCVLLLACTKEPTVIDTQYNSIQNQIDAVKESLPEECMTPAVQSQFSAIESQLSAQRTTCESAVEAEKANAKLWELLTYTLAFLLGYTLIKRILK